MATKMSKTIIALVFFFGGAFSVSACAMPDHHESAAVSMPPVTAAADSAPKSVQDRNKEIVLDFYQKFFGDKDTDSIDLYVDAEPEKYIQHNPWLPNGREPLKEAAKKWFAEGPWEAEVKKVAAEGDLVFIHVKTVATFLKKALGGQATAIVDIFRLKDEKIVEHWDVIQPVTDMAANDHPFF